MEQQHQLFHTVRILISMYREDLASFHGAVSLAQAQAVLAALHKSSIADIDQLIYH